MSSSSLPSTPATTLYSAGSNSDGPLGLSHTDDVNQLTAACQPPAAGQRWQHVVTSGLHTLALTNSGQLYAWGSNSHGQCGQFLSSDTSLHVILSPQLITLPTTASIKHVACGWRHTLIVTTSNELFVFGDNSSGQLGLSSETYSVQTPTLQQLPLSDSADIVSIATGWQHSVCVTADGSVYAWGKNSKGQLGVPVDASHKQPYMPMQAAPPHNVRFSRVVCGWQHTMLLSACRTQLYGTGSNQHGQLCVAPTAMKHSGGQLIRIQLPQNDDDFVADVKCGWSHCLGVTSKHRAFAFGRNDRGQCGVASDDRCVIKPALVRLPADSCHGITHIACGSEHSLFATDDALYGCGWNEHGNLGLGTANERVSSPTLIPVSLDASKRIVQLHAAGAVTMLLTSDTD